MDPLARINLLLPENCPGIFTVEVVARFISYHGHDFPSIPFCKEHIEDLGLLSHSGWQRIFPNKFMFSDLAACVSFVDSVSIHCLFLYMFSIPRFLGILPLLPNFSRSVFPLPHRRLGTSNPRHQTMTRLHQKTSTDRVNHLFAK